MERTRADAIRGFFDQMRGAAGAVAVVTFYMIATAWPYTRWPVIAGWTAVQTANQLVRWRLLAAWRRRAPPDAELARWAHLYTAHMAVSGAIWGATMFLFAHPAEPVSVALTVCALYGVSAGSMPGQAYHPPALWALVVPIYTAILVRLALTDVGEYILLGVASVAFAATMVVFCRVQARVLDESYRIRFENEELLEAVRREKASADAANLAKSQVLAAASHDLRQPLYALGLFAGSLAELGLDARGEAVVANIQGSIRVMEQLFEGLLDLSRLESGSIATQLEPVSVDEVFDRLSQVFRPIAVERGLEFRLRSDGEWVTSDPTLLEQVLANLVTNAIRATPRGGVLLAARGRPGGAVSLEVWDTGRGIAETDRQRIFDEFVQLDNPARDRRKGLGLGLSIARRAAALLGTTVTLASRPGLGSRFALVQPRAAPAAVAPQPATRTAPVTGAVLLIEDDETVRLALVDLLGRWGLVVDAAADGTAALALALAADARRYARAITDYRLPGAWDGLTLAQELLRRRAADEILIVTAELDPRLIAAARTSGIDLVHKPLDPARLRALLGLDAIAA